MVVFIIIIIMKRKVCFNFLISKDMCIHVSTYFDKCWV